MWGRMRLLIGVLIGVALLAGCGGAREAMLVDRLDGHVVIELVGIRFQPDEIKIKPGTQVVFVNKDRMTHNVVTDGLDESDSSRRQSPMMSHGDEWAFVFEEEGVYEIMCTVSGHNRIGMVGKIIVTGQPDA